MEVGRLGWAGLGWGMVMLWQVGGGEGMQSGLVA